MVITIERHTPLAPQAAWAAVTDFAAHAALIPLTHVLTDPRSDRPGVGWRFIARTRLGPLRLDDPMLLTRWEPPGADSGGLFQVEKVGRVLAGWTVATVHPAPGGSTVRWTQHLRPRFRLPPPGPWVADLIARRLYGSALDGLLQRHRR